MDAEPQWCATWRGRRRGQFPVDRWGLSRRVGVAASWELAGLEDWVRRRRPSSLRPSVRGWAPQAPAMGDVTVAD